MILFFSNVQCIRRYVDKAGTKTFRIPLLPDKCLSSPAELKLHLLGWNPLFLNLKGIYVLEFHGIYFNRSLVCTCKLARCAISEIQWKMVTKAENHWFLLKIDSVGPKLHQISPKNICSVHNTYTIVLQCYVHFYEVLCSCSGQNSYECDWDSSKFKCHSARSAHFKQC